MKNLQVSEWHEDSHSRSTRDGKSTTFRITCLHMVVSQNQGTRIWAQQYYIPYHKDPQNVPETLNPKPPRILGNPHISCHPYPVSSATSWTISWRTFPSARLQRNDYGPHWYAESSAPNFKRRFLGNSNARHAPRVQKTKKQGTWD